MLVLDLILNVLRCGLALLLSTDKVVIVLPSHSIKVRFNEVYRMVAFALGHDWQQSWAY